MDKLLDSVYYDVDSPAAYSGINSVYREAKKRSPEIKLSHVKNYLSRQKTYSLHKPVRRRFKRQKVVSAGVDVTWFIDLCDMSRISQYNDKTNWILTVTDVLSKHCFAVPLKRKTGILVKEAFESILKTSGRKPMYVASDSGKEFLNKSFQDFLLYQNIHHYTSKSDESTKMSNVERLNRTVKTKLWKYFAKNDTLRWIEPLPKIIHGINHSINRMHGMRPVDVTMDNEQEVRAKLFGQPVMINKFKFKIGDVVRISKYKHTFEKGYLPNFTSERFIICKRMKGNPATYRIKDLQGEEIDGIFYSEELSSANESPDRTSDGPRRKKKRN